MKRIPYLGYVFVVIKVTTIRYKFSVVTTIKYNYSVVTTIRYNSSVVTTIRYYSVVTNIKYTTLW